MSIGHAYGRDNLDSSIIKFAAPVILPALTHVINLSLGTACFPAKWKLARVVPVLKNKDLDTANPGSYRPICQLPVVSKLTERVVQSQLLSYLETSGQISMNHHSYRNKYSTTTALIQLMDSIATGTDSNLDLDLSAAFDCVRHSTLKEKLKYYGLDSATRNRIDSYLDSRSSFVVVGSAKSAIKSTPHGVPQGSVLGPLLYLMYVNEIPSVINNELCPDIAHQQSDKLFGGTCRTCGTMPMYADDGQYQTASNSQDQNQDQIENNFRKLKNFLNANSLQINESKTGLTYFMSHQKRSKMRGIPPDLTVRETVTSRTGVVSEQDRLITDSTKCRMLGMSLKNNQTWDAHLSTGSKAILPAVRRQVGLLSRIRKNLSKKALLLLVNSLAMSKMSYAICLWGNTTSNYTKRAQSVQNLAARLATGLPRFTRQVELLNECNWLDIQE